MENIEKMINNIINELDWRIILDFYHKLNISWYAKDLVKKNSLKKRNPSLEDLQNELRTVCRFVIEKRIAEYTYENWTIFFLDIENYNGEDYNKKDDFGCQLEVFFCPTRSLTFENNFDDEYPEREEKMDQVEMEISILNGFLDKAIEDEKYEMASIYRDKINTLIKNRNLSKK